MPVLTAMHLGSGLWAICAAPASHRGLLNQRGTRAQLETLCKTKGAAMHASNAAPRRPKNVRRYLPHRTQMSDVCSAARNTQALENAVNLAQARLEVA